MRRLPAVCVLALVAVELFLGIAAGKPKMVMPATEKLIIQEGDKLQIRCMGRSRIKFSTQENWANVNQSEFYVDDHSYWLSNTFTRPNVTKVDTGWYACAKEGVRIQNDEQTIHHPDTDISWVYVYVNSSEPFAVDTFEDVAIFSTNIPEVEGPARSVVVPCRPTSPNLTVILEINDGKLTVPENTTYDPRLGFILSHVTPELRKGIFKCKIDETYQMYTADHWPSFILDPVTITGGQIVRVNSSQSATLSCDIEGDHVSDFMTSWMRIDKSNDTQRILNTTRSSLLGETRVRISLDLRDVSCSDNGTYYCRMEYKNRTNQAPTYLFVFGAPAVDIDPVEFVSPDSVYLSWAVNDGNNPVKTYSLQQRKKNVNTWTDISDKIGGENSSCYIDELEKSSTYEFRLTATNSIGVSHPELVRVTTLDKDTGYGVKFLVGPVSNTSVSIDMYAGIYNSGKPSKHVHNYEIKATHRNRTKGPIYLDVDEEYHVIDELETGEFYSIEMAVCNKYTGQCSERDVGKVFVLEDAKTILNITVKEMSNHSVEVSWYEPVKELRDLFEEYRLNVYSVNDGSRDHTVLGKENYLLDGLKSGIEYRITVGATYEPDWDSHFEWYNAEKRITISREKVENGQIEQGRQGGLVALVVSLVVAILLLLIMAGWMIVWKRGEKAARRRFIEASLVVFRAGARDGVDPELAMAEQAELLPYDKKWEFPRNLLTFDKVLGSGAFGIVKKAEAKSICKREKYSTVAVKMVRATHRLDHMMALQRELKILVHLGKHINIVNLLGACTKRISYGELLVIVEFCRFGNLLDYLLRRRADFVDQVDVPTGTIAGSSFRTDCLLAIDPGWNTADFDDDPAANGSSQNTDSDHTSVTVEDSVFDNGDVGPFQIINYEGDFTDSDSDPIGTRDLLCWAWQISRGMKYLSSKNVVHGDLAARNILLSDNNVIKICDFGLAKALYASDIYKKEGNSPLPVKWMPIESIGDRVFSVKSDVWSFGVVLWELFTLGKTPYPGIANESVYTKLVDGYRMEKPEYATEQIYQVMLRCWEAEPSNRPSFKEIVDILDELLEDRTKDHYVSFDAVYAKINAEELANGKKDYLTMSPSEYASGTTETTV